VAYAVLATLRGEPVGLPLLFLMALVLMVSGLRDLFLAPEVARLRAGARLGPRWFRGPTEASIVRRMGWSSLVLGSLWWVLVLLELVVFR
jgi:hypothetical protein